jgi:hypothetical protein
MAPTMTMNNKINLQKGKSKITVKLAALITSVKNTKQAPMMNTNNT